MEPRAKSVTYCSASLASCSSSQSNFMMSVLSGHDYVSEQARVPTTLICLASCLMVMSMAPVRLVGLPPLRSPKFAETKIVEKSAARTQSGHRYHPTKIRSRYESRFALLGTRVRNDKGLRARMTDGRVGNTVGRIRSRAFTWQLTTLTRTFVTAAIAAHGKVSPYVHCN